MARIYEPLHAKSQMKQDTHLDDIQEPIMTAPPEVKQIIEQVWMLEKNRLDKKVNTHINEDVIKIIKEAVK